MKFDGKDIGGKETGPAQFNRQGEQAIAESLSGLGRKLLGEVKHYMSFNDLTQHQRQIQLQDGSVIRAHSIKGKGGMADIDKIYISVPGGKKDKKKEKLWFMCTGFIVQMRRTNYTNNQYNFMTGPAIVNVPHVLDPDIDSEEPDYYDKNGWIYAYGTTEDTNWADYIATYSDNNPPEERWYGFTENGFAVRNRAYIGYPNLYDLSMDQTEYMVNYTSPANGPRIAITDFGAGTPPLDFYYDVGHVYWNGANAPFIDFAGGGTLAADFQENVDFIDSFMSDDLGVSDDHEIASTYIPYLQADENYLMAGRVIVENQGNHEFNFEIMPALKDFLTEEGQDTFGWPYAMVALFPNGSTIKTELPRYRDEWPYPFYVSDYEFHTGSGSSYDGEFSTVLASGVTPPNLLDGAPQTELFMPGLLHPLQFYVDYPWTGETFVANEHSPEATPEIVSKAGYYKVQIPAWDLNTQEKVDGVTYDLDITLFGTNFEINMTLQGETGRINDKLRILVNTPIEYEEEDFGSLLAQILVVDR